MYNATTLHSKRTLSILMTMHLITSPGVKLAVTLVALSWDLEISYLCNNPDTPKYLTNTPKSCEPITVADITSPKLTFNNATFIACLFETNMLFSSRFAFNTTTGNVYDEAECKHIHMCVKVVVVVVIILCARVILKVICFLSYMAQ
jgi:hypothetical protein